MTGRRFFAGADDDDDGLPPRASNGRFRATSGGGNWRVFCTSGGGNWRVFCGTSAGGNGLVFWPLATDDEDVGFAETAACGGFEIFGEPFCCWEDGTDGFLMLEESLEEDCAVLLAGGFLDAVSADSSLLLPGTAVVDGEGFCRELRFSSGREEDGGLELELAEVGFGGAADGFSDPVEDEFSFGMRPFGAITFVLVDPGLLALVDAGGIFPAFIASYCASLICRSFSERRGSFRIRSRIFFCSR